MEILEENPNIVWEKRTSKNGKDYYVGSPKTDNTQSESLSKNPFDVDVNWPVGNGGWIVQDGAFIAETGISRYQLDEQPWYKLYHYVLWFTCQEHYDYYFTDQEGDIYNCNVFKNGDHYIQYNSDAPTITHIKGS